MAITPEPRPTVAVIAFSAKNIPHLKTVNIVTSRVTDTHKQIKEHLQIAAASATRQHRTVMDSGGSIKGLPTIHIAGYTGPA